VSVGEQYEFETGTLQAQSYQISRDLSSWVASLGVAVQNNGGGKETYGLILTFTLKDLPNVRLPLAVDPTAIPGLSSSK
jgi:hypothetical protein